MARLESKISECRRISAEAILLEIRYCVREFGFSPNDIFSAETLRDATKRRPRYFDPVSGATWSGVGRVPKWIGDKDREQFQIDGFDREE
ncbi:H-NS histone family protein [Burkholderia lata]|uniref:H-NS histone family protein n=1 Tax=Burkholderia lata (strain ATCC 17760 / DSM 23089 / LMG 22485 / NCIMB 9086 / R18194 / 383) TaxID=482957 RepID=UPI001582B57D|nr:H-NS histone family protein [Burkholderia lata]